MFTVFTTTHFDREFKDLLWKYKDITSHYNRVLSVLKVDPYNRSGIYDIKKLTNINDGAYRIRTGRFRFRYDVVNQSVYLKYCSLRNEGTYK